MVRKALGLMEIRPREATQGESQGESQLHSTSEVSLVNRLGAVLTLLGAIFALRPF